MRPVDEFGFSKSLALNLDEWNAAIGQVGLSASEARSALDAFVEGRDQAALQARYAPNTGQAMAWQPITAPREPEPLHPVRAISLSGLPFASGE